MQLNNPFPPLLEGVFITTAENFKYLDNIPVIWFKLCKIQGKVLISGGD
jgi:hypothetical protein